MQDEQDTAAVFEEEGIVRWHNTVSFVELGSKEGNLGRIGSSESAGEDRVVRPTCLLATVSIPQGLMLSKAFRGLLNGGVRRTSFLLQMITTGALLLSGQHCKRANGEMQRDRRQGHSRN